MDVWFHHENPYPFVPQEVLDRADSVRASLPNKYCDPHIAAALFEEALDEFMLCDAQGLNVVAIEHHAGINSLFGANPLILGILARQTRKARILSLGTLVSLRPDPVRIAEEYATADVISRGRLEIGFVKSGGSEMASNNANPVTNIERYWEAIDLITKALTSQEGPFRWEGQHYTHRHVNIWPRPWQQPHPRMWAATGDPTTAREVGRRGMVNVLLLWFVNTSLRSAPQYAKFLPGAVPPQFAPQVYRTVPKPTAQAGGAGGNGAPSAHAVQPAASAGQNAATLVGINAEQAMARGLLFAGSPDTVYQQIMDFYDKVGGFGHLVMIGRSGFMTHAEAEKSIKLFGQEVLPRLKEIAPVTVG